MRRERRIYEACGGFSAGGARGAARQVAHRHSDRLVAVLLGGAGSGGPEVKFNYDVSSGVSTTFGYGGQTIYSTGYGLDPKWSGLLVGGVVYLIVIALVLAAAYFILGSIVGVGYAKYNLGLVDRTESGFEALFAYLPNWKTTTLTRLWKGLYILLGTILLVIPGLIMGSPTR